jgi:hypothetical protein
MGMQHPSEKHLIIMKKRQTNIAVFIKKINDIHNVSKKVAAVPPITNRYTRQISYIVLLLAKNQQMQEAFSQPHLGAFFAPQKTGLSGGSAACAAAPRPSNPLRKGTPAGEYNPGTEFCNAKLSRNCRNAAIPQSPEAH